MTSKEILLTQTGMYSVTIGNVMIDSSVYHALSQCKCTGLERLHRRIVLDDGHVFRVYLDNFGQYRGVLFKSSAHKLGYAGVALDPHGYVRLADVCPAMRDTDALAAIVALLRQLGIAVELS